MSLSLDGSTGIVTGLDVTTSQLPGGSILQVVQSSTSTQVAVTNTTYTDTGLSASITPASSSNKILAIINQGYRMGRSDPAEGFGIKIFRDSTEIYTPISDSTGPFMVYRTIAGSTSNVEYGYISMQILDAPNSTSSLTYKVQGRPYTDLNSGLVRFQQNASTGNHQISYITLMEVAA